MRRPLASLLLLLAAAPAARAADDYTLGPDSMEQQGVPRGKVTKHTWTSKIFPGTVRDYWVYVPAQYDPKTPACVMVFQDGGPTSTRRDNFASRSSSTTSSTKATCRSPSASSS